MNARSLAALLALAAAGCTVDNNASIRLSGTCTPPTPSAGACTYDSTCTTFWMSNLWVDTTYKSTPVDPLDGTLYWPFEVENLRTANTDREGGTNTAIAFITGYKIHYVVTSSSPATAIPDVTIDDSSRIVPEGGKTVVMIPVIPRSVATSLAVTAALKAQARAEIRATGTYADGSTFETGPYSVVVDINNGAGIHYTCPAATTLSICPKAGQSGMPTCE